MQYKTIPLRLLEDRPEIYEQLRRNRQLLPTMERLAKELKTHHEAWKDQIAQERPGSDPSQISSEAMEMAIQELVERLPIVSPPSEDELSLDSAMASLLTPTRPA